jgi:hypothetical protein
MHKVRLGRWLQKPQAEIQGLFCGLELARDMENNPKAMVQVCPNAIPRLMSSSMHVGGTAVKTS